MVKKGSVSFGSVRFQITLLVGVLSIVAVMTVSIVGTILTVADRSAREEAATRFQIVGVSVRERTGSLLEPAATLASMASFVPGIARTPSIDSLDDPARYLFSRVLSGHPAIYSAYIGHRDGSFLQVIAVRGNDSVREAHAAPPGTVQILRTITVEDGLRTQNWTFLDGTDGVLGTRRETDFSYDPRIRPWYLDAVSAEAVTISDPYTFSSSGLPGITVSRTLPDGTGVVGVDITTAELTSFLANQAISPGGGSALFTATGTMIAAAPEIAPFLEATGFDQVTGGDSVDSRGVGEGTGPASGWLYVTTEWSVAPGEVLVALTAAPAEDFLAGAMEMRRTIVLIAALVLVVIVPVVVVFARGLAKALSLLATDAERVGAMDFSGNPAVTTPIYEFQRMADAFVIMKATIAERTERLQIALEKLQMLVDMAIAMSAEYDLDRLSEMILQGAKRLAHADGGSLYLVNDDRDTLEFMIVLNDSLGFQQGGTSGDAVKMRPVPLYDDEGNENHHNVVTHAFHNEKTVNIPDAYDSDEFDFSGTRSFDAENGYRSRSFLTIPLKPRGGGDVMGALQLINATDPESGEIVPFPESLREFVEALSSAAAVAVQNWKLMEQQKRLFDDLVRFVGTAIDGKSPYTARHCTRVSDISIDLVRAADSETTGRFARVAFTPSQVREFEIAAWLHDCGKITTPEHVIDKATKLETIYNRIHEIRTRFEVLLRDARIEYLTARLEGQESNDAEKELARKESQLFDDFAFVAACNRGTEYMEDAAIERLEQIGDRRWVRHFDDRLGLSIGEEEHLRETDDDRSDESGPVEERLLADRPEHIALRKNWTQERYDAYGFRFDVPDRLYNRGELYNLSTRRGTLTAEERFKINEHVAQTIVMLETIRFPEELRRVTQYAGEHHEMLDGSGYPRHFADENLSLPSRILAFADIFEALTSTDRPYRQAMKLSDAIRILAEMVDAGKIDGEVFRLFLRSGIYRRYAETHMRADQIDEIDVARYVTP